ncbi:MAG: hypothetical protein RJA57_199 [Bacteroidota bacterium]|jgi:hypothetical protein
MKTAEWMILASVAILIVNNFTQIRSWFAKK